MVGTVNTIFVNSVTMNVNADLVFYLYLIENMNVFIMEYCYIV